MPQSAYSEPWWRSAVFYQVYPRSFADGNGDGTGDLIGLVHHLDHLVDLGVDAIWISPFYCSPMADGGYDVSDPCDVDPLFGTLEDFDALLAGAHDRGIKVTVDVVPNHFSDQHPWFRSALAAGRGSPERARFIFRTGRGVNGEQPPNNWPSIFGGPAWKRTPDGDWYLHIFAPEQPDLDWTNREVPAEFDRILRFWLECGVDGFRIDVGQGMAKPEGLPDMDLAAIEVPDDRPHLPAPGDLRWDRDGVHEYHRGFRRVLDDYPGERVALGEVWASDDERLARYVRPDELHLAFNFELVVATWGAGSIRNAIESSMQAMSEVGAPCTWTLANHDVDRAPTRYGGRVAGLARARAAALVELALPGAVCLYNGEELGLENVDLPDEALQDPTWARSDHTVRGRDGERVPLPWSGTQAPYGFTSGASTWLPMPSDWAGLSVAAQDANPESTLNLYRAAVRLRRLLPALTRGSFEWVDAGSDTLCYRRADVTVVLNAGSVPVALPPGEVLLASGPLAGATLPSDTAVWLHSALDR